MRLNCTVAVVVLLSVISVVAAELPEGAPEGVDSNWFGRMQEGIRDGEYNFGLGPASYRPGRGEVFQAPNRALDLRIYFDAEGLEILERSSDDAPTVGHLSLEAWGREGAMDRSPAGALRENEGRMERLRGALTETYTNSAAGLELGWELSGPPHGEGPVVLTLELEHASVRAQGGGVEIISENGRRLVLQTPQVIDREGEVVPAQLLVAERDRLELRVDDGDAAYPLYIKTLLTGTADATLESDQA
ncbi:MAG: hypothetical protein KAJ78_10075, partial [Acidobacteria bacterium]|nr:hypothetical protein [Acidobacteriota bacterium]